MKDGKNVKTKKKTTSRPKTTQAKPKVTKINEVKKEESFVEDVEGSDNRLIVFIAIAILVIVGTIIALVVGCEKKKEPEPEKPTDDIVIPVKPDEGDNKGVETKEVVRKVASVYKGKKTKEKDTTKETEYNVTYYLYDEETEEFEQETNLAVKEGSALESYVPDGYSSCTYYTSEDMADEMDMTQGATKDAEVYMVCSLITYNVTYNPESTNPSTYTVKDPDTTLTAPEGFENFDGWYTESGVKVEALNKEVISYADDNNTIALTGKSTTEAEGTLSDGTTEPAITGEGSETDEGADETEGYYVGTTEGQFTTTAAPEGLDGETENPDDEEEMNEAPEGTRMVLQDEPGETAEEDTEEDEGACTENCEEANLVGSGNNEQVPPTTVVTNDSEGTDEAMQPEEGKETTVEGGNVTEEVTPAPAKEAEPAPTPPVTPAVVSTPAPTNKVVETQDEESEPVTEVTEGETE